MEREEMRERVAALVVAALRREEDIFEQARLRVSRLRARLEDNSLDRNVGLWILRCARAEIRAASVRFNWRASNLDSMDRALTLLLRLEDQGDTPDPDTMKVLEDFPRAPSNSSKLPDDLPDGFMELLARFDPPIQEEARQASTRHDFLNGE